MKAVSSGDFSTGMKMLNKKGPAQYLKKGEEYKVSQRLTNVI